MAHPAFPSARGALYGRHPVSAISRIAGNPLADGARKGASAAELGPP